MRNSRGVGADYRRARSFSPLIAHLDPVDVCARACLKRAWFFPCVLIRGRAEQGCNGDTPVGFVVRNILELFQFGDGQSPYSGSVTTECTFISTKVDLSHEKKNHMNCLSKEIMMLK